MLVVVCVSVAAALHGTYDKQTVDSDKLTGSRPRTKGDRVQCHLSAFIRLCFIMSQLSELGLLCIFVYLNTDIRLMGSCT